MELYLDSVDFKEIEAAFKLGFVKALTTTPTFMHKHGITDIQGAIVKLSGMVPDLQVDKQDVLEGKVDKNLDVSSLVVPIGGIGTYPTMVERTTALDWLSSTIAHDAKQFSAATFGQLKQARSDVEPRGTVATTKRPPSHLDPKSNRRGPRTMQ